LPPICRIDGAANSLRLHVDSEINNAGQSSLDFSKGDFLIGRRQSRLVNVESQSGDSSVSTIDGAKFKFPP